MGLAPLIVVLKTLARRTGNEEYNNAARFWMKIFGINFVVGVVTGIPMEFQFGTNWARFSHMTGGVIGQALALWVEAAKPNCSLVGGIYGVSRIMAVRILHHCD